MELSSPEFEHFGLMPAKYTCAGENISPPLEIEDVPEDAESLILVVSDPDAPGGEFLHWVVWNIDPGTESIPEGDVPESAIEGINGFNEPGYGGPCPPTGEHRYVFTLYAVDKVLELRPDSSLHDITDAMSDRVMAEAELVGLYSRNGRKHQSGSDE
ncbi:MAG: YbhB/YbcL family Raf kinase inhibitor-like protein [Patescibacteria group bacterium]|jgi:hypothetical protein